MGWDEEARGGGRGAECGRVGGESWLEGEREILFRAQYARVSFFKQTRGSNMTEHHRSFTIRPATAQDIMAEIAGNQEEEFQDRDLPAREFAVCTKHRFTFWRDAAKNKRCEHCLDHVYCDSVCFNQTKRAHRKVCPWVKQGKVNPTPYRELILLQMS